MDFFSDFGINLNNFHRSKSNGIMHICNVRLIFKNYIKMVKIWSGYQKGPSPSVSSGPLHLKHVVT